jgi:hypothetical protein
MSWMDSIGPLLRRYTGSAGSQPEADVENHFDQVAQTAPRSEVAEGLSAAFRSDQTPPFAQMASQLFGNSSGAQRAGVLNALLAAAGSSGLASLVQGAGSSGLGSLFGGSQAPVSPEQAAQVSPEAVKQLAEHAEKSDPSIVDRLSQIYSEHPGLIKTLGGAALTIALAKVAERQRG